MNSSTQVTESRIIQAPIDAVWRVVSKVTFDYWDAVDKVSIVGGVSRTLGSEREVHFKDGAVQRYQIVELSDLHHSVTYELIESDPAVEMSAALHTIRLFRVTHDNTTYVEFHSQYSSSGEKTMAVVEDSRLKKREILDGLSGYIATGGLDSHKVAE